MRVFLGGTCNGSLWREQLIPYLDKLGIDYFNPVVDDWTEKAQKQELIERQICDICLYTITPLMIGVYSIAEVVDDSNKRPDKTILLLLHFDDDKSFNESQWKSLNSVAKMVQRNGGKVFYTYAELLEYLITLCNITQLKNR